jgi:Short C-terminal domain
MPGLIGGIARTAVIAGTATAVSNRVSRRQADRWARQDQSDYAQPQYAQPQYAQPQYAQPAPPAPAVASSGTDEMLEQLRELGQLKDQGVLTEEEFAAQKARILGT